MLAQMILHEPLVYNRAKEWEHKGYEILLPYIKLLQNLAQVKKHQ